jgi:hypothetical protein
LGLTVPDNQSPLTCRPAPKLLKLMAERLTSARRPVKPVQLRDFIEELLYQTVFGDYHDFRADLGIHVLEALGLLAADPRSGATVELVLLFADASRKGGTSAARPEAI